jgi:peptide/nickel transport system permease protein
MSATVAATQPAPVAAAKPPTSPAVLAFRRFRSRPAAVAGLVVVVLLVLVAALAPWIVPDDPIKTSWTLIRKAPSWAHWMGTDENGRDVLSRVIYGARASLLAGLLSVTIAAGIGVPVGLVAGFAGGIADAVISRIVDAMLAVPFLILAIALAAFLGPSLENAMIAIGVTAAPIFMRISRAATMDAATNEYVEAARALGNPPWRGGTCCPTSCRRSWCRRRWRSRRRSSPRPACRSWVSGSSRRRRAGAAC